MGGLTLILSPSVNPIEEWRGVTPMPLVPQAGGENKNAGGADDKRSSLRGG